MSINNYDSIDDYIIKTINNGTNLQKLPNIRYLTMHVSAQKILQRPNNYKLYILNAEKGPFKYQSDNNWDRSKSIQALLSGKYNNQPLIKLTRHERKFMNDFKLNLKN
jgi:hypothetical protein